jgi:hypothetical protein
VHFSCKSVYKFIELSPADLPVDFLWMTFLTNVRFLRRDSRKPEDPLSDFCKKSAKNVIGYFIPIPGTDVIIFKIFSPKKFAKKLAFLIQNKAKF